MTRISESDLILPALYVIHRKPGITTSELISELREIFNPVGEDAEILRGRNDDKFSQIVRNLVSHHTLDQRLGYTFLGEADSTNSRHFLSEMGTSYLKENLPYLEGLLSNDFRYAETLDGLGKLDNAQTMRKKIAIMDENIFISEGRRRKVTVQVYERSKLLREKAIIHYTQNGAIVCRACGFDFYKMYGETGKGYIEMHHEKPIYLYEDSDITRFVSEALSSMIPLCANCHRMVHRTKGNLLSVADLQAILSTAKE